MRLRARRYSLTALAAATVAAALAPAATQSAAAGAVMAPGAAGPKWTKISSNTGLGIASAGLLRTADGRLHVVWASHDGTTYSLHYSTMGGNAKLLGTGTILQKWSGVSFYPRLVPGPSGGIRLIFTGSNGVNGSPFDLGAMYTATAAAAGTKWTLFNGSMSHSTIIPETDDAAVTESNGTPVAGWAAGAGLAYHVGTDSHTPATTADGTVTGTAGSAAVGPVLARNSDRSVWFAWFTGLVPSAQGYYVDQILPSKTAKVRAPSSGGNNLAENQPLQSVAFTARAGGGLYLAYCVPTKTLECAHIDLWKVGAAKAATVPGTATGHAIRAAIAAAPGGHLWILWYDTAQNKIHLVRTNAAATKFGPVQTISGPPSIAEFDGLQAEGSQGPLDVISLVLQTTSGSTPAYWDTQLLPALKLAGSPSSVKHTQATTVTFTVTDVGDPVAGATVKFLGKTVTTNSKGVAKVTVPKGTSTGNHTATASKPGYTAASFTVKVT